MLEWFKPLKMQHQERLNMSKTGQWVFEMQEDASDMTLAEFIAKHGESASSIWYETNDC
jgi:hypothetical protein